MDEKMVEAVARANFCDDFRGDNAHLLGCAAALLELDRDNALVPHGIGGHARSIINALGFRLARIEAFGRDTEEWLDGEATKAGSAPNEGRYHDHR